MNTELKSIMRQAEGRFLAESEVAAFRQYATGMESRIGTAKRLEESEREIVSAAADYFFERFPSELEDRPDPRERTARDYALTLRYVALAYVRDDDDWFREQFAEWISETLLGFADVDVLQGMVGALRQAMDEKLDAADARALTPFVQIFHDEIGRQ